jgi:hypothetical protein
MNNDILEFLSKHFKSVVPSHDGATITCPNGKNHSNGSDANPSCSVFPSYEGVYLYFCHSCGAKGALSKILSDVPKHTGTLKSYGDTLKFTTYDKSEIYASTQPVEDIDEALSYCLKRGISITTILKCGMRATQSTKSDYKKLFLPSFMEGEIVGLNYRNYHDDPKYFYPEKGTVCSTNKSYMVGQASLDPEKPCLIVEGIFDYLKCLDYGLGEKYNVLAMAGASIRASTLDALVSVGVKKCIFWFDNDLAGHKILFDGPKATKIFEAGGIGAFRSNMKNKKAIPIKKNMRDKIGGSIEVHLVDYGAIQKATGLTGKDPCAILNSSDNFNVDNYIFEETLT